MKTDEKPNGQDSAQEVRTLLDACKVRELPACKRAGMATSTLLRWRRGSCPKPGQVAVLRRAIMEIAAEVGTLPAEYSIELDQLRQNVELPAAPAQQGDLAARVGRLERVVEEQLGVTL